MDFSMLGSRMLNKTAGIGFLGLKAPEKESGHDILCEAEIPLAGVGVERGRSSRYKGLP